MSPLFIVIPFFLFFAVMNIIDMGRLD
jgi:hypothetical protein